MRLKVHYVVESPYLWSNIAEMARVQDDELLNTLQAGFLSFIDAEIELEDSVVSAIFKVDFLRPEHGIY